MKHDRDKIKEMAEHSLSHFRNEFGEEKIVSAIMYELADRRMFKGVEDFLVEEMRLVFLEILNQAKSIKEDESLQHEAMQTS